MHSVGFISLGCPKNQVDCELMIAGAQERGLKITAQINEADAIVINTCSFIGEAIEESDREIRGARKFKERGHCRAIIVAGCLPQYFAGDRREDYPWVDAWLTPDQPRELGGVLLELLGETSPQSASQMHEQPPLPTFLASAADGRALSTPGSFAYVKIAEGCNHACRFCIIPNLRGHYRSRTIADVVTEVEGLVARGISELVLVSQDSSFFGRERGSFELPQLLSALHAIPGDFWVRVMYLHPDHVTDELLATWHELTPKVLPYFDIPLQHISPDLLKAMGRGGGGDETAALLRRLRAVAEETIIRTSLIVGYPGETKEQFNELLQWVEAGHLDWCGVFAYSELSGMASAGLAGKVSEEEKVLRRQQLVDTATRATAVRRRQLVGRQIEVMVESCQRDPNHARRWVCQGRSWREAYDIDGLVRFPSFTKCEVHQRQEVTVRAIEGIDLLG